MPTPERRLVEDCPCEDATNGTCKERPEERGRPVNHPDANPALASCEFTKRVRLMLEDLEKMEREHGQQMFGAANIDEHGNRC